MTKRLAKPMTARRKEHLWNAVFGACVARQVFDRMRDGHGAPEPSDMDGFNEEAETVADMALDAWKG